jgi:hypothetical protein
MRLQARIGDPADRSVTFQELGETLGGGCLPGQADAEGS